MNTLFGSIKIVATHKRSRYAPLHFRLVIAAITLLSISILKRLKLRDLQYLYQQNIFFFVEILRLPNIQPSPLKYKVLVGENVSYTSNQH